MVDQAYIQSKINFGYGKAATYLGASYQQYRPTSPTNPIAPNALVGSIMADFDINPGFTYKAPTTYGKAIYYGLFDGTNAQIGDYLIGPRTFFIANMEPERPPMCVWCNRTAGFFRPRASPVGPGYYSGDRRGGGEQQLLAGWPISELQGIRGEKGPSNLPGDTRMPWGIVLLPAISGVTLEANDRMNDDIGRWWTVSSVELTAMGWRLTAILADT